MLPVLSTMRPSRSSSVTVSEMFSSIRLNRFSVISSALVTSVASVRSLTLRTMPPIAGSSIRFVATVST